MGHHDDSYCDVANDDGDAGAGGAVDDGANDAVNDDGFDLYGEMILDDDFVDGVPLDGPVVVDPVIRIENIAIVWQSLYQQKFYIANESLCRTFVDDDR